MKSKNGWNVLGSVLGEKYYMLIHWDISCPVTEQEKQINIINKLKFIYYLTGNSVFLKYQTLRTY